MRQLGYPSLRDMNKMLVKGIVVNVPVTIKDILRAEKIYGPDVASLKGKTVKKAINASPRIYVPRSMAKTQDIYSDLFYCKRQGFVLSVLVHLRIVFINAITKSETRGYLKSILDMHIGKMLR